MPELVWKSYIDFEISQEEPERARQLYERLLEKTLHVKVLVRKLSILCIYKVKDISNEFQMKNCLILGLDSICQI